jgi:hypothetical protein
MLAWVLAWALAIGAGPRPVAFPGPERESIAPGGRYALEWTAPPPRGERHQLVLVDRQSGARRRLLTFRRRVEALWSADGRRLALTDHSTEGEANVYVWADLREPPSDLEIELRSALPADDPLSSSPHLSLQAESWLDEDRLIIRVDVPGAAGPPRRYEHRLGGGFTAR